MPVVSLKLDKGADTETDLVTVKDWSCVQRVGYSDFVDTEFVGVPFGEEVDTEFVLLWSEVVDSKLVNCTVSVLNKFGVVSGLCSGSG